MTTRVFGPTGSKRKRRFLFLPILVAALVGVGALVTGGSVLAAPSTDANVNDYAQCANDKPGSLTPTVDPTDCVPQGWINGILNANNSQYREDQVTPQRVGLDLPNNGPTTGRTITVTYLARKGQGGAGNHAYDSLATWNYTETNADRCQGLLAADCPSGSASTLQIPSDSTVVADSNGAGSSTALHELPAANRLMTMYGGTIDSVSAPVHDNAAGPGDDYATVTVSYHVASTPTKVQLLFGGHLAPSVGPRGWGNNVGASFINGGPYHIRLDSVDSSSLGNRDNQIMSGAILPIGTATQTALHETNSSGVDVNPANNQNPVTQTGITVTLPANGSGTYVTDYATVAPAGSTGTVAFRFYSSQAACNGDTTFTGGTSAGSGKTLDANSVAKSDPVHITAAGVIYWRAVFTGTGISASSDSGCSDEILTANQATSTSTTLHQTDANGADLASANNGASITATLPSNGDGVYVKDYASILPASVNSGTVTFRYYATQAACSADTNGTGGNAGGSGAVSGGSASGSTVHFTSAGVFYWRAFYGGDAANHINASTSACGDEVLTVNQATSTSTTLHQTDANGADLDPANNGDPISIVAGGHVTDYASVTPSSATGSVAFKWYATQSDCGEDTSGTAAGGGSLSSGSAHSNPVQFAHSGTFYWKAFFTGTGLNNNSQSSCEVLNVINPGISISKLPHSQTIRNPGTATWTIKVTNTGDAALSNVHVDDAQAPGCAKTASEVAAIGPPDGVGSSTLQPGESVSYDCSRSGVTDSFTNTAVATGTPPVGDDVAAQDSADVLVINPHISISKKPDTQTIRNGGTATWTITVENDGDSPLTNVHVDDTQAPGCAKTAAEIAAIGPPDGVGSSTLQPGDSVSYQCSLANVTADFTNTATATGTPEVGDNVTAQDSADVDVINPHISVVKSPDSQTIVSGQTATFTIQVINDGDVTLTNVVVTDALAPGCARTKADIPGLASMPAAPAAGSTITYSCTLANVTSGFTNLATATGTPPIGPDVSSQDTAGVTVVQPVTHPAISIVKDPNSQTVTSGGTATFTITVLNTGDVTLTDVTVTDARSPDCDRTIGTLTPGQSVSYKCTKPNVTADFDNVAIATGHAGSTTVTAQDTAHVNAKAPFVPKKPKIVSHKKPKTTG